MQFPPFPSASLVRNIGGERARRALTVFGLVAASVTPFAAQANTDTSFPITLQKSEMYLTQVLPNVEKLGDGKIAVTYTRKSAYTEKEYGIEYNSVVIREVGDCKKGTTERSSVVRLLDGVAVLHHVQIRVAKFTRIDEAIWWACKIRNS